MLFQIGGELCSCDSTIITCDFVTDHVIYTNLVNGPECQLT